MNDTIARLTPEHERAAREGGLVPVGCDTCHGTGRYTFSNASAEDGSGLETIQCPGCLGLLRVWVRKRNPKSAPPMHDGEVVRLLESHG